MKKLLLIFLFSFLILKSYAIIFWQPYPITAVITSNGSQYRIECSVYDSLLGSWQYYNTPYFNNSIDTSDRSPEIIVFTTYFAPNINDLDSIYGYIIYDQELHQFVPVYGYHSDPDYPGAGVWTKDGVVGVLIQCCEDPYYNSPNKWLYAYIYDIKVHSWKGRLFEFAYAGDVGQIGMWIGLGGLVATSYNDYWFNPSHTNYFYDPILVSFDDKYSHYIDEAGGDQDLYYSTDDGMLLNDFACHLSSFDPLLHDWQTINFIEAYGNYLVHNGIFYTKVYSTNYFGIYDDSLHQWVVDDFDQTISKIKMKDRVVAYADTVNNPNKVFYQVFSPTLRAWVKDSTTVAAGIDSIYIQDGTVKWVDNNSVLYKAGYNDATGWGNFDTPLLLNFYLTDLSGSTGLPLIYIRNYSIGTDSVMYDFGDGITTNYKQSSLWHQYKVNGHYTVSSMQADTHMVCIKTVNAAGLQSSCQSISYSFCSVAGTASVSNDSLCYGDSTNLILNGYTGAIQWQRKIGAASWINETGPGATSNNYWVTPLQNSVYRAMVTDSICVPAFTDTIAVAVTPLASVGTATISYNTICSGTNVVLKLTGYVGVIQWQSFDGVTWVNETGTCNNCYQYTVSPAVSMQYRAIAANGTCSADTSITLSLTVLSIIDPVTVNDTICGPGIVNLSASGTGVLNWFADTTSGVSVNTGTTYSPNISSTTTYYVQASSGIIYNVGPVDTTFGPTGSGGYNYGLLFDVNNPATIEKVYVYPQQTGSITVSLKNSAGQTLKTFSTQVTAGSGKTPINLKFVVNAASGYRLVITSGYNYLKSNITNAAYPYTIPGSPVTITSYVNSGGICSCYYFFYDWEVSEGCKSNIIPVTGVVGSPPTATIFPGGPLTFCVGGSVTLFANSGTGFTFQWTKNGNPISGATSQNYLATTAGLYRVIISKLSCSTTSLPVTVTTPCLPRNPPALKTGFDNPEANIPALFVFYHPSFQTSSIKAQNLKGKFYSLHVYDLLQKEIFYEEGILGSADFTKELNCNVFAKGMYIVSLQTEQELLVKKFIKD